MAKYNKKIVDKICELVRNGVFNKDAAEAVGIDESTFYEWVKTKPEFSKLLKKANAIRKKNFILAIAKAANKTWQAAAWYLERVYNDQFARKEISEHTGEVGLKLKEPSEEMKRATNEGYKKELTKKPRRNSKPDRKN